MAAKATSQELNKPRDPRYGLVLARMSTNTDHNEGDVILWTGPETFAIRELTKQEIDDYVGHKSQEEKQAEPEKGSSDAFAEKARSTVILEALSKLDHADSSNWTESGQPTVSAVSRALMSIHASNIETSRPEIRKFAPNFKRERQEVI